MPEVPGATAACAHERGPRLASSPGPSACFPPHPLSFIPTRAGERTALALHTHAHTLSHSLTGSVKNLVGPAAAATAGRGKSTVKSVTR